MPGKDGTGPLGNGPYTGRMAARRFQCFNRGKSNFGKGFGRGYFVANTSNEDLESEKKMLEDRIKSINSQIENN